MSLFVDGFGLSRSLFAEFRHMGKSPRSGLRTDAYDSYPKLDDLTRLKDFRLHFGDLFVMVYLNEDSLYHSSCKETWYYSHDFEPLY